MSCKTCGKTKDIKLNAVGNQNRSSLDSLSNPNIALFETSYGRFLYFMLLMFVALTPIINLVVAYMFYKAVYGFKNPSKNKETKDNKENPNEKDAQVNQDSDQA